MKTLVVSDDRRTLEDIRKLAGGVDLISELTCHAGSLAGMQTLPVKGEVDVLMLDCRHGGAAQLAELERLIAFYPTLATMLIVNQESPDLLLRALRLGVREVIKVPLAREDILSAFHRILDRSKGSVRGLGQVCAFMSCKGGSGATSWRPTSATRWHSGPPNACC